MLVRIGLSLIERLEVSDLRDIKLVQLKEHHHFHLVGEHRPAQVADQQAERSKASLGLAAGELDPMVQAGGESQTRQVRLDYYRTRFCAHDGRDPSPLKL